MRGKVIITMFHFNLTNLRKITIQIFGTQKLETVFGKKIILLIVSQNLNEANLEK
jgi:hypothetical protein